MKKAYLRKYRLVWLPPLGFNNTFAMIVRSAEAQRLTSRDLSAAVSRNWRLGVGYEFITRPDGLAKARYSLWLPLERNAEKHGFRPALSGA